MSRLSERREVWNDETLFPCTTAASIAFRATGADADLFADYLDFVGGDPEQNSGADWILYPQYLEGEIGIAVDRDDWDEYQSPADWDRHHTRLAKLWAELDKLKPPHYNANGVTQEEHERYCRQLRDNDQKRVAKLRLEGQPWGLIQAAASAARRLHVARATAPEGEPEAESTPVSVHERGGLSQAERDDLVAAAVARAIEGLRALADLTEVSLRSAADTAVWAASDPD